MNTYTANIYCGRRVRYSGIVKDLSIARKVCSDYCDDIGECVSFNRTEYIYKNGSEPGIVVGFINYPRFSKDPEEIKRRALQLAELLMDRMEQIRVTVVCSDETIMLTNPLYNDDGQLK